MCPDPDPALVQGLDGDLVALPDRTEHVPGRDDTLLQNELGRARRPDSELVLLLTHGKPRKIPARR